MAKTEISRRLLRDEVYETILNAIIDGTLEPGEELPDEKMLDWLGTSRTPLREALNKLVEHGIVEFVPHRHTRVAEIDFRKINEAMFVTGVLHEHAARKVTAHLSTDQLQALQKRTDALDVAKDQGQTNALGQAIEAFFLVFEDAYENAILIETVQSLSLQLIRFLTPRDGLRDVEDIISTLKAINAAAQKKDAATTAELIHRLYQPTRQNFLDIYRGT